MKVNTKTTKNMEKDKYSIQMEQWHFKVIFCMVYLKGKVYQQTTKVNFIMLNLQMPYFLIEFWYLSFIVVSYFKSFWWYCSRGFVYFWLHLR